MDRYGHNIDSKFRFVIVASKRAKQLLRGSKPKLRSKSRNLIRIAQQEVSAGSVEFEILPVGKEDFPEAEDRVIVGGGIGTEDVGEPEAAGADKEELAGSEAEEAAADKEESEAEGEEDAEEEGEGEKEEEP